MCEMCDGKTVVEHLQSVLRAIDSAGWCLMSVEGHGTSPPWSYTVGLQERFGHPELVLLGLDDVQQDVVCSLAEAVADGDETYEVGQSVPFGDCAILVRAVHPGHVRSDLFSGWYGYYEWRGSGPSALAVLQLVPDDRWFCSCHAGRQIRLDRPPATRRTGDHRRRRRR